MFQVFNQNAVLLVHNQCWVSKGQDHELHAVFIFAHIYDKGRSGIGALYCFLMDYLKHVITQPLKQYLILMNPSLCLSEISAHPSSLYGPYRGLPGGEPGSSVSLSSSRVSIGSETWTNMSGLNTQMNKMASRFPLFRSQILSFPFRLTSHQLLLQKHTAPAEQSSVNWPSGLNFSLQNEANNMDVQHLSTEFILDNQQAKNLQ